jgi:DNA-binding transcriptional ArsR family regulator
MGKSNFLLVDLSEKKTKKLAETITSDTSRKILDYLADKEDDTESSMAAALNIPISTVHYHLQKLSEAKLIVAEEFHYSKKGREVQHYKLANKYIIIAPKKISGLKEKLKGVLPVGLIVLGVGVVWKSIQFVARNGLPLPFPAQSVAMESAVEKGVVERALQEGVATAPAPTAAVPSQPDVVLWFLVGSLVTIALFVIIAWVRSRMKK